MKKTTLLVLMLFGLGFISKTTAQHKAVIYGNLGVSNVNIGIVNTKSGTSSNAKGHYALPLYDRTKDIKLYYSCIGYQDTLVSLTPKQLQRDSINISFKMHPINYTLKEVTVSENKPEIAYHEKMVSLETFEINEMGIYLIAYQQSGKALLHLSFDLDTLSVLPIARKYDRLYKDVFGQIHLISYDSTYQIGHRQVGDRYLDAELLYGMTIEDFYWFFGNNAAVNDSVFIISTYNGLFSQELYYHYFNRGTPDAHLLEYTFNQESWDVTENIMTFGLDNIFPPKPIYDPVFALEDSIILFNFEADKIEYFDQKAQMIGETPIKFHRYLKWNGKWIMQDSWKKEVLVDRVRKVFYAVFEDESVTTIKKIDLKTGKVQNVATLSGFQFVQFPKPTNMYNGNLYFMYHTGLTVNDGTLYFLYHTGPTHSKALYRMKID